MLTLLLAIVLRLIRRVRDLSRRRAYWRSPCQARPVLRARRKPHWVRQEVIRLKALMPDTGTCRAIEALFNRRFARKRNMTIGRTFVSEVIRRHRYEIDVERRRIKNAKPKPVPRNLVWGLDLTGKSDTRGQLHSVLGLLDHGTRANLRLAALANKSTFTLLGHLFLAFGRYGKPSAVRTDNESVFASRLFRLILFIVGIRHQRTDTGCPWQNGRIERFFGTLKNSLDRLAVDSLDALDLALTEFRFFYNHVRPHQNLGGATPVEAWRGINPYTTRDKGEYWFEAWEGLLCGYYMRR
jgi:transposase InsO family protein